MEIPLYKHDYGIIKCRAEGWKSDYTKSRSLQSTVNYAYCIYCMCVNLVSEGKTDDKELFNKHNRDITTKKYYSNKQTQDYIDSINDIKIGEYVVHYVHGIGIYNGIVKQTIDDNQKDYLEIQFQG